MDRYSAVGHRSLPGSVNRHRMELIDVRRFRDVVPFQPLFWLGNRLLPRFLAESMGTLVRRFDLLRENPDQRVVVFRKAAT